MRISCGRPLVVLSTSVLLCAMAAECPYCGRDLISEGRWSKQPEFGDNDLCFKVRCVCGHVLEEVYSAVGIYDPEAEEYIHYY